MGLRGRRRPDPRGSGPGDRTSRRYRQGNSAAKPRAGRTGRRTGVPPTHAGCRRTTSTRSTSPIARKSLSLAERSARLLASDGIDHVDAAVAQVLEHKFYADLAGTTTRQQRVRFDAELDRRVRRRRHRGGSRRWESLAPPVGRGWEFLTGTGWDWDQEIAEIPVLLAEKMKAPSVEAGNYDLVIDPSNLWLTIHESIGHATELDPRTWLRGGLRGHQFRDLRQAGFACLWLATYACHR